MNLTKLKKSVLHFNAPFNSLNRIHKHKHLLHFTFFSHLSERTFLFLVCLKAALEKNYFVLLYFSKNCHLRSRARNVVCLFDADILNCVQMKYPAASSAIMIHKRDEETFD